VCTAGKCLETLYKVVVKDLETLYTAVLPRTSGQFTSRILHVTWVRSRTVCPEPKKNSQVHKTNYTINSRVSATGARVSGASLVASMKAVRSSRCFFCLPHYSVPCWDSG